MSVTSLEELKKISQGQEVELQGWGEEPFICKLKRPSLLGLVGNNLIPNPLLHAAYILFNGSRSNADVISLKESKELYTIVAKAAMVEPSYEDLENVGLELTDLQLLEIYKFTQLGVRSLISFRTKQSSDEDNQCKSEV